MEATKSVFSFLSLLTKYDRYFIGKISSKHYPVYTSLCFYFINLGTNFFQIILSFSFLLLFLVYFLCRDFEASGIVPSSNALITIFLPLKVFFALLRVSSLDFFDSFFGLYLSYQFFHYILLIFCLFY